MSFRYHIRFGISRYDYTRWQNYVMALYEQVPWKELHKDTRMQIMKLRYPKPALCPSCSSDKVLLFALSPDYPDDIAQYEYSCRKCHEKKWHPKPDKEYKQSEATRLLKSIAARRNALDPEYRAKQAAGIEEYRRTGWRRKNRDDERNEMFSA